MVRTAGLCAVALLLCAGALSGAAGQDHSQAFDLTGPWTRSDPEARFMPPVSGPGPLQDDPARPHHGHREGVAGQPDESATPWIPDLRNPILQPWVMAAVRKAAEDSTAGVEADTALLHCRPDGVPGVLTRRDNVQFLRTANEVAIVYQLDHQIRHVYLNVSHSPHPAESWYGESIGHFEGDTLVVDTIGMNDRRRWTPVARPTATLC